jgi:hypothetical protein
MKDLILRFFLYACAASWLLNRFKPPTTAVTFGLMPLWLAASFTLWRIFLR